jgi:hypothetical protein
MKIIKVQLQPKTALKASCLRMRRNGPCDLCPLHLPVCFQEEIVIISFADLSSDDPIDFGKRQAQNMMAPHAKG